MPAPLPAAVAVGRIRDLRAYIRRIKSIQGARGSDACFRVACILRDAGLSPEESLAYLLEWNQSCADPPWSVTELEHKVRDAFAIVTKGGRFVEKRSVRSVTGEDRAVMYTLAQRTGLRRKELCSLSPSSFDLASTPPIVRVRAGDSKHRKADVLPLAADVAELLRNYLAGRPNTKPIWPRSWWRRSAEMLYADLEAAGINPVADDGTVVDFHGQRVTFITELARVGNSPIAVQKLARHSDFNLTLRTYTRLQIDDLVNAVEKLPVLGGRPAKEEPPPEAKPEVVMPDDARLKNLVAVWPSLPEHIKNAIAMLAVAPVPPPQ